MTPLDIQYYGFDFPPHSLISILKSLDFKELTCVILFDPFTGKELPYDYIRELDKNNLYVIITTQEGASDQWFDRLIPQLVDHCGVAQSNIILRSSCLYNPNSNIKQIHTFVDNCFEFISRAGVVDLTVCPETTHHFICLNRLHRWQRYNLVINLLDQKLDKFGVISYLSPPTNNADPGRFPMQIDWDINQSSVTERQHRVDHPGITGALFNVITESSYENTDGSHYLPMLSEKSFKCFILHQIPIWLTPYHSVICFRELGFDVFDDIVDHSYDLELDPVRRIELVTNQIEKICKLTNLNDIRQQLKSRFLKNIATLKSYTNYQSELPQWKKIFFG
jgi:hypothetical protein